MSRLMVTGSRSWRDIETISDALWAATDGDLQWNWTLIQGCASGADAIARSLAVDRGMGVEDWWPDYVNHSFAEANLLRNQAMVDSRPDVVLAFPTPGSRGTWHSVGAAKRAGIEVRVFEQAKVKSGSR